MKVDLKRRRNAECRTGHRPSGYFVAPLALGFDVEPRPKCRFTSSYASQHISHNLYVVIAQEQADGNR